ncbi:hypothetical protein PMAYCL1PPCAC_27621, partial [Pristionchus mayeri]
QDIDNLMAVKRRICNVATDMSMNKIKRQGGTLRIYPTSKGYEFCYSASTDPFSYGDVNNICCYEVFTRGNGYVQERRFMGRPSARKIGSEHIDTPVPDQFFAALSDLLRTRAVKRVEIDNIIFDTHFISNMKIVLIDQHLKFGPMFVSNDTFQAIK